MAKHEISKTFCILPWVQIATNTTGYLRLCCSSTPGKNILTHENRKLHVNKDKSILKLQNSNMINDIRSKMLKGERIDICTRCYREESASGQSPRTGWNNKFQKHITTQIENTSDDGSLKEFKPLYIDLRLGNLCNLKCRMCNPYSSKKWIEDWNQVQGTALQIQDIDYLNRIEWFKDDSTWDHLSQLSLSLEEIYFTGGEPFLIHQHLKLLKFLVEAGKASKIKLKYNTNATTLPEKLPPLWHHFKRVTLNVSIDGVGKVNDYIRNPSDWNVTKDILNKFDRLATDHKHIFVNIHSTVQVYNINYLTDIYDYLSGFKSINPEPFLNILNHPEYLNIKNLPIDFKLSVKESMLTWLNAKDPNADISQHSLNKVIQYMLKDDWSHKLNELKKYTFNLDARRGEDLKHINPELFQLLDA